MQIIGYDDISNNDIVGFLKQGKIVIYPFDTCYGLVADALNQESIDKIIKYKSLREGKAISVVMSNIQMIEEYAYLNPNASDFIRDFLPGPFTIILKSKGLLANGIESVQKTLGIRIPQNDIVKIVELFGNPVTATSANQSYKKTPYKLDDILDYTNKEGLGLIDYFIDKGELTYNPPSTVVDFSNDDIRVLRKGSIIPNGVNLNEELSNNVEETIKIAEMITNKFIQNIKFRPLIFALQGDMGAGKTHFTKGIAKALGIKEEISSPTFIIADEYNLENGNYFYHIDTWRLNIDDTFQDLKDIGFLDMLKLNSNGLYNVLSIEWSDRIITFLNNLPDNKKVIWIEINKLDEEKRLIKWCE